MKNSKSVEDTSFRPHKLNTTLTPFQEIFFTDFCSNRAGQRGGAVNSNKVSFGAPTRTRTQINFLTEIFRVPVSRRSPCLRFTSANSRIAPTFKSYP